jgi:hypothetical protein
MIRWASLALLTACFGDPIGSGRSPEERMAGVWTLTVRAGMAERIDLRGEVRVIGPCAGTVERAGDSPACTAGMKAWYRLAVPRPMNRPPCDEAEVRLSETSDSVIVILSPQNEYLRRELRGVLYGDRMAGHWAGPTSAGWAKLQSIFFLNRIERSSGLTDRCDR